MAKKILVPVFPSERFYEAVVRAADIVADEGGLITFAFTRVRPTPEASTATTQTAAPAMLDITVDAGELRRRGSRAVARDSRSPRLEEARRCSTSAASATGRSTTCSPTRPTHEGAAQAIADEAAAGAYDLVVLSRGYFEDEVNEEDSTPADVAAAVQALEGPRLIVA